MWVGFLPSFLHSDACFAAKRKDRGFWGDSALIPSPLFSQEWHQRKLKWPAASQPLSPGWYHALWGASDWSSEAVSGPSRQIFDATFLFQRDCVCPVLWFYAAATVPLKFTHSPVRRNPLWLKKQFFLKHSSILRKTYWTLFFVCLFVCFTTMTANCILVYSLTFLITAGSSLITLISQWRSKGHFISLTFINHLRFLLINIFFMSTRQI